VSSASLIAFKPWLNATGDDKFRKNTAAGLDEGDRANEGANSNKVENAPNCPASFALSKKVLNIIPYDNIDIKSVLR